MRISKLPVPLLLAAAALTSVAVIYVYLQAPPMPIHTDPNFTQPLFGGVTYLWRGAAFEYIFSADYPISVAYGAPYHLIYLNGPLYNITLGGGNVVLIYGVGIRPLYIVKKTVRTEDGRNTFTDTCFVYKLTELAIRNAMDTGEGFDLYLPRLFDQNDVLTNKEESAVASFGRCSSRFRVVHMTINGTHIVYQLAYVHSPTLAWRVVERLSSPVDGKTIRLTNQPLRGAYAVDGSTSTYVAIALPYLHFAITPSETTTLTIYVN